MSTPNDPFPTDEALPADEGLPADENLDELHADHDTTFPAVEDEPTADEPGGDEPAPMAGDPDLQSGHLGE